MRQFLHRVKSCLSEFMNTWDEFHSCWIGFTDMFCFWTERRIPGPVWEMITREYWYYRLGKFCGFLTLIIISIIIYRLLT